MIKDFPLQNQIIRQGAAFEYSKEIRLRPQVHQ